MFTILVVEDDAPLQRMMSAFLGLNGFSVVGAQFRKSFSFLLRLG